MSVAAGTIARKEPEAVGLDYARLLAEGIALAQQLSGAIWTNFNYSDPGVTILEQLCYALTELSYRAEFAVEDLLGAPDTGQISLPRQGLYPAWAIMPVNPVTPADLRRLLLDQVSDAANVWVTPMPARDNAGVAGLYRIAVLARAGDCECDHLGAGAGAEALVARVLASYGAHRALCEDVQSCHVLRHIPARVQAEVHLDDRADPDEVLAQLLFMLGLNLAPEPRRTSLAQQHAAGLTTSEIFLGPLMLRGFIADDQLTPLSRQVVVESLLEVMAEVRGVLSVEAMAVRVGDDPRAYRRGETIDLAEGSILRLQTGGRDRFDTLRLYRGGVRCTPDPHRVRRRLDKKWAVQRQTHALWTEYRDYYRPPAGRPIDLQAYSSIQDQFPAVYGIGPYGLPQQASAPRRAQARQLKGYLMAFDQLMADFFSQLAFVRDLFSVETGGDRTYACQSLRAIVPDAAALVDADYVEQLQALIAARDPVLERQSAVLDLLLSLYAALPGWPGAALHEGRARAHHGAALLKAKRALLARMVPATRDRGRGVDYHRSGAGRPMAGLEIRCRIELELLAASTADKLAPGVPHQDGAASVQSAPAEAVDSGTLFIVEWLLLRHGDSDGHADSGQFNFRISAVMPARHDEDEDGDEDDGEDGTQASRHDGWRRRASALVRANTPAHIVVDAVFLGPRRMNHFLRLYDAWCQALRDGSQRRRGVTSRRLAHFLRQAPA